MILRFLIDEDTTALPIASVDECYARIAPLDARFSNTVDRAAAGGFVADRIGYAFVAGYRAALSKLDPTLDKASLAASETGGAHPRAIETRLVPRGDAFVLDGEKTFSTLASAADVLLVVASRGETRGAKRSESRSPGGVGGGAPDHGHGDRNHLQVARIPTRREGVTIRDREPIAFAPEIPHARVTFREVRVEPGEILEGDGYERFVKPFRTIEDVHVMAAWLGHVVRLVRAYDEPGAAIEQALAAIAALRTIAEADPLDPGAHIALAGVITRAAELAAEMKLGSAEEAVRARWQRDLPLLAVAGTARNARLEAAHRYRSHRKGSLPRQ